MTKKEVPYYKLANSSTKIVRVLEPRFLPTGVGRPTACAAVRAAPSRTAPSSAGSTAPAVAGLASTSGPCWGRRPESASLTAGPQSRAPARAPWGHPGGGTSWVELAPPETTAVRTAHFPPWAPRPTAAGQLRSASVARRVAWPATCPSGCRAAPGTR